MANVKLSKNQISRLAYHATTRDYGKRHMVLIERIVRAHRCYEAFKDECIYQYEKRNSKTKNFSKPLNQCLIESAEYKFSNLLKKAWNLSYLNISQSSWAGGNNTYNVHFDTSLTMPKIDAGTFKVWSNNGKWSGTDFNAALTLPPSMRFSCISGVLTIYKKDSDLRNGCSCWWIEQSRGCNVRIISGYLVRGNHIKAKSLENAKKLVMKKRQQIAIDAIKRRYLDHHRQEILSKVWVSYEDSIKAGNCRVGTDTFCKKIFTIFGAEIGGIKTDKLLQIAKDSIQLNFVERAINYSIKRYGY